jgi:feruloyl-CoA synthase
MSAKPDISVQVGRGNAPLRAISFGDPAVSIDRRDDGTIYLRPKMALGEYPVRLTDRLHRAPP